MRYLSHEKYPNGEIRMTVCVRRWWAPWTWRRIELFRCYSCWYFYETGAELASEMYGSLTGVTKERASMLLTIAEAEEKRIDALLAEAEPPRLLSIGGGRR